jgi:hypothetical protein
MVSSKFLDIGLSFPCLAFLIASHVFPQALDQCTVRHNVGKIVLYRGGDPAIGGNNYIRNIDCVTGGEIPVGSCIYPKNSSVSYLGYGGVWIGGMVKGDTLVSGQTLLRAYQVGSGITPWEFHSPFYPDPDVIERSSLNPDLSVPNQAVSEQDFITTTTDTVTGGLTILPDYFRVRSHTPLGIEVINRSYAWSLAYAEDIVLFDWTIRNISNEFIHDAIIGINVTSSVGYLSSDAFRNRDDVGGFLNTAPFHGTCQFTDSLTLMWFADNDGDPVNSQFVSIPTVDPASGIILLSCRDVAAIELLEAPSELVPGMTVSYNWWRPWNYNPPLDFGPRHKANFRDFRTGGDLGTPFGDVNQYYIMKNGEVDYDPVYTYSITPNNETWMYPQQDVARDISDGCNLEQILSFGPIDIPPGGEVPFVFAFVMGENLHTDPRNLGNLPYDPEEYYANLDFSDLIQNAQWARYIYDNPGIDTDGDGYFGEYRICVLDSVRDVDSNWIPSVAETTYYKGDGVPDWRVALPPPSPKV